MRASSGFSPNAWATAFVDCGPRSFSLTSTSSMPTSTDMKFPRPLKYRLSTHRAYAVEVNTGRSAVTQQTLGSALCAVCGVK